MLTAQELEAKLVSIADKSEKLSAEITAGVAELRAAIAAQGSSTPAMDAAIARIEGAHTISDEVFEDAQIPDTPTP